MNVGRCIPTDTQSLFLESQEMSGAGDVCVAGFVTTDSGDLSCQSGSGETPVVVCGNIRGGLQVSWNGANNLAIFGGTNHDGCANNVIHNITLNADLDVPRIRILINQFRNIFVLLNEHTRSLQGSRLDDKVLLQFSHRYRSVIQSTIYELQTDTEEEKVNLLQELSDIDLVWSLAEALFIRDHSGPVVFQLIQWLQQHSSISIEGFKELVNSNEPHRGADYWSTVFQLLSQNSFEEAATLLSQYPAIDQGFLRMILRLLEKMPILTQDYTVTQYTFHFESWQEDCRKALVQAEATCNDPRLLQVCRLMSGDESVFMELLKEGFYPTWYAFFVGYLFFVAPFSFHSEFSKILSSTIHSQSLTTPVDQLIHAMFALDSPSISLRLCSDFTGWWFPIHMSHIFRVAGFPLKPQDFDSDNQMLSFLNLESEFRTSSKDHTLKDSRKKGNVTISAANKNEDFLEQFLLLEYGSTLMSHCSLWRVGLDYLAAAGNPGLAVLATHLERLGSDPGASEKKAKKILGLCKDHRLDKVIESICRQCGSRHLKNGNLGTAMTWALSSKDSVLLTNIALKFLEIYETTGEFLNLDLLDNLGSDMLLSPQLTFLCKYREFHRFYQSGNFVKAGDVLTNLISSRLAPQKFWSLLLLDALPLLEQPKVALNAEQTYELMECLEEIILRAKYFPVEHQREGACGLVIKQSTRTVAKESTAGLSAEESIFGRHTERLELLRLALSRNLARTIL